MRRFLLVLLTFLWTFQAKSQLKGFYLKPEVIQAFNALANLQTEACRSALAPLDNQPNGLVDYLHSWSLASDYLISGDPTRYREFLSKQKRYEERLLLCDPNSPFFNYCLARFHLHAMLAHAFYGDELESALALKKANAYYRSLARSHPDFVLTKELGALIQALISAIPPAYEWVGRLVGLQGSLTQAKVFWRDAMSDFTQQSKDWAFYHPIVHLEWQFLEANLGDGFQEWMMAPVQSHTSAIDRIARMIAFQKKRNGPSLMAEIQAYESDLHPMIPIVQYWKAEVRQNLAIPNTEGEFQNFLQHYRGDRWRAAALRRIAWSHLLLGDEAKYHQAMKKVQECPSFLADEDQQALREAQSQTAPHPKLLRARLVSDAGSFSIALNILNRITDPLNEWEETERAYRKARAFQGLEQRDSAIVYFEWACKRGARLPEYYAAASSFQLGVLHLGSDKAKAIRYLKAVSTFPKHPYKKSLDAKASAVLQTIQ